MRRDRNILNSAGSFSFRYNLPYYFLKFLKTAQRRIFRGELTSEAKIRLAFLEFYRQVRNVSVVCQAFLKSQDRLFTNGRRDLSQMIYLPLKTDPRLLKTREKVNYLLRKN